MDPDRRVHLPGVEPSVDFLQRQRSGAGGVRSRIVFAAALVLFLGLLGLLGYPLVNSSAHVAGRLPTMVDQVQKGHGWLAHTLRRFHLLSWVQKNAPKLKSVANNLAPAGAQRRRGRRPPPCWPSPPSPFSSLFMLLEAPKLRLSLLANMRPDRRQVVEDVAHRVAGQVTAYVLGTIALSLMFGVVVVVTLFILGVPFALIIGLWVALVAMIPLVGGLIAGVPSVIIATLHSPTSGVGRC